MKKADAIELISKTFEAPFEREGFIRFVRELLNGFENDAFAPRKGRYIPDAFGGHIESLERVGVYREAEKRIDILIVHLKKETSLERARTMQRNFIAGYLRGDYGSASEKDAALVAFISADPADWRFSLVKLEYALEENEKGHLKGIEKFTPARRWSFLLGSHEKSHTAQTQLVPILADEENSPTLERLEKAFDIETVSDEFFTEYRRLFIETKLALDEVILAESSLKSTFEAKNVNSVDFAKKLLGQIIFLYYLQKKGWFGVPRRGKWGEGSKNFLRELFEKKHGDYKNFFNDILEPLFYEALRRDRSDVDHYYSRFDCKIPFLNGGLFDPIGDYDWVNTDLLLPNELFANKKEVKGDKGTGILDVFDRYNFTVREDEPFEKEVAIDPELLGKAYEKFNAIRPDNFDEYLAALGDGKRGSESKFNKKFGVYYTPREIVHYMCQQSLIQYLHTALNEQHGYQRLGSSQTEMFGNALTKGQLSMTEARDLPEISVAEIEDLILRGERIKENDARVVAAGRETRDYKFEIPESIRLNASRLDEALATVKICDPAVGSGAFPVGMMNEIVKAREVLRTYQDFPLSSGAPFRDNKGGGVMASTYHFKRACIENSLYGVDIDPGAVEIAKLRLWLLLIVDEEDPHNIKPLPNLDYKLMQGNSLLGLPEGALRNPETLAKLEEKKKAYFDETHPKKKAAYRQEIAALFDSLVESARLFDPTLGEVNFDFQTHFSEVFQENDGFDVVIGNPPYVQLQKNGGALADMYQNSGYQTFSRMGDIYALFYEKGTQILCEGGHLTFITSNKWMRAGYGKGLRVFLLKNTAIRQLIDFGDAPLFENATTYTNIFIGAKEERRAEPKVSDLSLQLDLMANLTGYLNAPAKDQQADFTEKSYLIVNKSENIIKQKVEKAGTPLKDWDVQINYGIKTGYNNAFIIDGATREKLISADPKAAEIIKPVLRGKDIKRYSIERRDEWIINSHNGLKAKNPPPINVQQDFPSVYEHLKQFLPKCEERADQGDHWSNLRNCAFLEEFEKEKIVWAEIVYDSAFYFDNEAFFMEATGFMMTGEKIKTLTALLNSRLLTYAFRKFFAGGDLQNQFFRYKKAFLVHLPIIRPSADIEKKLESLVMDIQGMKKMNPAADTSALEGQIDALVYKLYGLTEEEIKIVEGKE